jgi:methionyl-tRNA formyltransferase
MGFAFGLSVRRTLHAPGGTGKHSPQPALGAWRASWFHPRVTGPERIVFMGTAPLAAAILRALHAHHPARIAAVVTQPDRPKGRDLRPQPSAVKLAAAEFGLPILQPGKARDPDFLRQLAELRPDLMVVAAYGQILPQAILDLPGHGCLNIHTSLLPKYRGAAPIQWAIANGDAETGVTLMRMDAGMDTGDILATARTPIRDEDNSATLHDRLAELGAQLLVQSLPGWCDGKLQPVPQDHALATHARKITKEDGRLDWSLDARTLWNRMRAFTPWPGAYTTLPGADRNPTLKILRADPLTGPCGEPGTLLDTGPAGIVVACGTGALRLCEVQREGSKPLPAGAFLVGFPLPVGARFR